MNNDSKNSIPIIPVSDVPSRPLNEDNEIFQNSKDGVNMGPSNRNKKSVAVKKLEKRIIRLTAQAITDFGMIEDGDRVMVAMSGGKDSFVLLDALRTLQKRAPIKFDLVAVNVDQHIPNFPREALEQYFKDIDVEYHIEDQDTYSIIQRLIPEGRNVCSLCAPSPPRHSLPRRRRNEVQQDRPRPSHGRPLSARCCSISSTAAA